MRRAALLASLLLAACASAPRGHRLDGVDVRRHPVTGWTEVRVSERGYAFGMPGVPSSFRPVDETGQPMSIEIHELRLEGSTRGYIVEIHAHGGADPEHAAARHVEFIKRERASAVFDEGGRSDSGALRTLRYQLDQSMHVAETHVFVTDANVFVLTAIAVPDGAGGLRREDLRFFASLVVDGRPMTAARE